MSKLNMNIPFFFRFTVKNTVCDGGVPGEATRFTVKTQRGEAATKLQTKTGGAGDGHFPPVPLTLVFERRNFGAFS